MSMATRAHHCFALNKNEVHYLRRYVRYLLNLRAHAPGYSDLGISLKRAHEIQDLAKTFIEQP